MPAWCVAMGLQAAGSQRAFVVQVLFCCMLRLPHVQQQRRCAKAALALCRLCLQRVAVNHSPAVPELPLPQVDSRTLPQSTLGRHHLGGSHCKDDAASHSGAVSGWVAADAPAAGDQGTASALQGGDRGMLYLRKWLNDESPEVRRPLCAASAPQWLRRIRPRCCPAYRIPDLHRVHHAPARHLHVHSVCSRLSCSGMDVVLYVHSWAVRFGAFEADGLTRETAHAAWQGGSGRPSPAASACVHRPVLCFGTMAQQIILLRCTA